MPRIVIGETDLPEGTGSEALRAAAIPLMVEPAPALKPDAGRADPECRTLRRTQLVAKRSTLIIGFALTLIFGLASPAAQATVKCQCNNGTLAHALDADYGDEDADENCNDACSQSGGGRVWSVDTDRTDDDVTVRGSDRRPPARHQPRR
jgi:hypothetical protein